MLPLMRSRNSAAVASGDSRSPVTWLGTPAFNSCLTLAAMRDGAEVTTVEGLAQGGALHPMQAAFVAHDGYQCGYCTPGQICSSVAMLEEMRQGWPSHVSEDLLMPEPGRDEFRERMSGNICRCGAYSNIQDAIADVSGVKL